MLAALSWTRAWSTRVGSLHCDADRPKIMGPEQTVSMLQQTMVADASRSGPDPPPSPRAYSAYLRGARRSPDRSSWQTVYVSHARQAQGHQREAQGGFPQHDSSFASAGVKTHVTSAVSESFEKRQTTLALTLLSSARTTRDEGTAVALCLSTARTKVARSEKRCPIHRPGRGGSSLPDAASVACSGSFVAGEDLA